MCHRKNLYIIGGTMGVGKTTTCEHLKSKLDNAVFLDGDWCWYSDPFQVTDETKKMVVDNICYLVNNYIHCSAYENIIFCWVMHEQNIIDDILSRLDTGKCKTKIISLVCREDKLIMRLKKDVRDGKRENDVISRSADRLDLYNRLNTIKIDVSDIAAEEAAEIIAKL